MSALKIEICMGTMKVQVHFLFLLHTYSMGAATDVSVDISRISLVAVEARLSLLRYLDRCISRCIDRGTLIDTRSE